jgi:NAD(P)-dependent dehydrogenase (short-subunit alcohol dehydrogenase family)
MASTDGQMGVPGELSYTASKGGVISLTKTLALEWAKYNINVNALGPCDFVTPMNTPFLNDGEWVKLAMSRIPIVRVRGQFGQPEEITGAAIFLASEASNLVTGHLLNVDGGRTIE